MCLDRFTSSHKEVFLLTVNITVDADLLHINASKSFSAQQFPLKSPG